MATPGWEKDGLICGVCNKPVNFKDGFIWDGLTNKAAHYDCRTHPPCPSCEKLRAENARLNGIIERATEITPLNCKELLKTLDEVKSALNQPKEDK